MKNKSTLKNIEIDKLMLDKDNPRFAELYSGSEKEEDLINYLLYEESAVDLAKAITKVQEFYPDRPLWVIKKDDKYLVKDGNRRCAAVKALLHPSKYGLDLEKIEIKELPILVYENISDIDNRIREEHTSNLFKKWGRIAKALEIHRLYSSGDSIESMLDYDSKPKDLIKLANFYYKAVKIGGEDLKKLLRSGRGAKGGKTIVFERLFKERNDCGYTFKSRTTNEVQIKNKELFKSYILAMVSYLDENSDTTSRVIDRVKPKNFLKKLKPFGFPPEEESDNNSDNQQTENSESSSQDTSNQQSETSEPSSNDNSTPSTSSNSSAGSTKSKPELKREDKPPALVNLIDETYNLNHIKFPNAKIALSRVSLECTLKYVVENSKKQNGKFIKDSNYFRDAFYHRNGKKLSYTNFDLLKKLFTKLIKDIGIRNAFEDFNLQRPHQIIHNYRVGGVPKDAKAITDNLIDLLEFLLQEENELLDNLDLSKL